MAEKNQLQPWLVIAVAAAVALSLLTVMFVIFVDVGWV